MSSTSLPVVTGATREAALAGTAMPFATLALSGGGAATATVMVAVAAGRLYADPGDGAAVSGGGTSALWISGTLAEIDAKLASLVYAAPSAGADSLTLSLLAVDGTVVPLATLPIAVLAPSGGVREGITVAGGTLTLEARTLDNLSIDVVQQGAELAPASLVLVNSALGAASTLVVGQAAGAATAPRIAVAGQVGLAGQMVFGAGSASLSLALGAVLENVGTISFEDSTAVVSGGGTLRNDGAIRVSGGAASLEVAVGGTGSITLAADTALRLGGSLGAGQTLRLSGLDTLVLEAPAAMQGVLAGFAPGDSIVLPGVAADALSYQAGEDGSGRLTVYHGADTVASLSVSGAAAGSFVLSASTMAGSSAIEFLGAPAGSSTAPGPGSLDVYRFFDVAHGTEFLTQDGGERDAIIAGRPDLVYEGVAMRALDASAAGSAGTVAVFRFFDTVHGTHFFTASTAERDSLLASRPDLVLEPSSTLYEHATQQAGDVAVFRFFDTSVGTHFYTDDAGERAQILATRPDLTDEGVAFYAPGR